jgi:hypothetical protein
MTIGTKRFTDSYMEYASEFTDAPKTFHRFMSYFLISTAVRRKAYVVQGHKRIYPNLWMVLLAPSSLFHKSYALSIAEDILRQAIPDITLPNEWSHESLLEGLQEKPEGVMFYDEFASLLAHLNRDYAAPARALLTSLYSCDQVYQRTTGTTVKRNFVVQNTFINIAAASTISWLKKEAKADALEGGFLPRFIFIAETERQKPIAFQPPSDQVKRNALVARLANVSHMIEQPAIYSPEALTAFESFYHEFITAAMSKNERLHPFITRLVTYLHKLAIICAIDRREYPRITLGAFTEAKLDVEYLCRRFEAVLIDELGVGEYAKRAGRVERAISEAGPGGIPRSTVLKNADVSAEWLDGIIRTLVEKELIVKENGAGKAVIYKWLGENENVVNQHISIR